MSKIDLSKFPKYLFTQGGKIMQSGEEYSEEIITTIDYKKYMWMSSIDLIHIEGVRDVYNSIDYVEHFLYLNGFIMQYYNVFEHVKLDIDVYIGFDNYALSIGNKRFTYSSEELLAKLKEILNTESLNKLAPE
jgi:hypothetical protein